MKRWLSLLLLLCPALVNATTTVTGTLQNLGTGTVGQAAFVRFWLRGCGGNIPRINGTAVIAPSQGGVYYFDMAANSVGVISGTLYSTRDSTGLLSGDIECGGSKTSVWYGMQIFVGGKGGSEIPVHAKSGVTLDITQVTPLTTNPVVTAPTGDSTYMRLDAGNSPAIGNWTFTGALNATGTTTVANLNGVIFADQQAGADACAKITTAFGLGNIVDARNFIGTQTCAGTFSLSSPGQVLLLGNYTLVVASTALVNQSNVHIYGIGNDSVIKAAGGFAANTPVVEISSTGTSSPTTVEGVKIDCSSITNGIGGENLGGQELSGFINDIAANCTKYGFWYEGIGAQNSYGEKLMVETAGTGAIGVYVHNAPIRGISNLTVTSNDGNTPADCMVIDGSSGTYSGIHNDKCTIGIDIGPTMPVNISLISTVTGGSTAPTNIKIENTAGNRVILAGISCNGGTAAGNIVDVLDGSPTSACYEPLWAVGQAGQGQFRFYNAAFSGTGIATLTVKTGSGGGNYTAANTTYAAVDTTNLCTTLSGGNGVTVPMGWKLQVSVSGVLESVTAAVAQSVAFADAGATCTSGGVTALNGTERTITPPAIATFDETFHTQYVLTGDGNAHAIILVAKTSSGSDAWGIQNASAAAAPSMSFLLMPSN